MSKLSELAMEIAALLVQVEPTGEGITNRTLTDQEQEALKEHFEELLVILVRSPGLIHTDSVPNIGYILEGLLTHFKEALKGVEEEEPEGAIGRALDDHLDVVREMWLRRIFDVVPIATSGKVAESAVPILDQATRAFLAGLDLATIGLGRAAMETVVDHKSEVGAAAMMRAGKAEAPCSPWAKDNFDPRPRRGNQLAWRIEDLHRAGLLSGPAAEHSHILRRLGNAAVHGGHGGRTEAVEALRRLSRFFAAVY